MNRRQLVTAWATVLIAAASGRAGANGDAAPGGARYTALIKRLHKAVADVPAPLARGRTWLNSSTRDFAGRNTTAVMAPEAATTAGLLQFLGLQGDASGWPSAADLQARSQQEFQCGRTIVVDGWVLARTEAAACGLLAALNGRTDD